MSIRKNTMWNIAGNAVPLLAGAVAIPFLMKRIGMEKFSIVTMIWTLIGYLSLFDFGLGRALTKLVARGADPEDPDKDRKLLDSAVFLTGAAGLIGSVAILLLSGPLVRQWLNITPANQPDALFALALTAIGVPLTTIGSAYRGVLEGYERFKESSIVRVFFGTATFIFPVLILLVGKASIVNVTISLIVARALSLAMYLFVVKKIIPGYRFGILRRDGQSVSTLLSFGSWMTLSNIISPILTSIDRYFISAILGAAVVAYYTVPYELIVRILIIPGSIGASLFPRLSGMFGSDEAGAYRLVRRGALVTGALLFPCCILVAALYSPGVTLWLGAEFAQKSLLVALVLTGGAFVNGISYVFYTAVQAKNGSKATGIMHSIELVIYVPMLYFMTKYAGIIGAAAAWSARVLIDCVFLIIIHNTGKKNAV